VLTYGTCCGVLAVGRRVGFGLALVVVARALGAILLYRYVDVGGLGPAEAAITDWPDAQRRES
jgi:hypothetical protein